jgi:hypothetical protein
MTLHPIRTLACLLMMMFLLHSCFEEESPVPPHEQGNLEEGQAALGPAYGSQVYFDLSDAEVVASNTVSDWDLSFSGEAGDWTIRLNSSRFMLAGNSMDTTFSADLDPEALDMRFDTSDGNPDSTAIGTWYEPVGDSIRSLRYVYLVDLGMDEQGVSLGYKKVSFDVAGDHILLRAANPDNSMETTIPVMLDPQMDRTYFSFEAGIRDIVPEPGAWSLLFTRYTTMLVTDEGEDYPYLVVGALLNPNGVQAALNTLHDFMDISIEDIADLEFTTRSDIIGYEWKEYDFDAGIYTIVPGLSYVIRDRDGYYYKLRFVDFYSDEGIKGYPTFEYVRL